MTMRTAVFGGSGYAGAELVRILEGHEGLSLVASSAERSAGRRVGDLSLGAGRYGSIRFQEAEDLVASIESGSLRLDVAFLALPHGEAERLVPRLLPYVGLVVDLSADYRLKDPLLYEVWYGRSHSHPELLERAVYGLPELARSGLVDARFIAVAGCYVTAATLALLPFARAGVMEREGVIVDAASGVSGGGRSLKYEYLYESVSENFAPYGLVGHRHTPEMEVNLDLGILFTPHLAPMKRGILATCYAKPTGSLLESLRDAGSGGADVLSTFLRDAYAEEPFVRIIDVPPQTAAVTGTNRVDVHAVFDPRSETVIALAALDNLTKGAAGQAVQCANLALGFDESQGLTGGGVWP